MISKDMRMIQKGLLFIAILLFSYGVFIWLIETPVTAVQVTSLYYLMTAVIIALFGIIGIQIRNK